ncbi:MAG: iron-containing alcohol dehydrogenase [Bacteroidales bacterium]|jgi:NADP-dependent alcohol dehydrogenase|nr:iron-containing alcohol dehydrogenase [Bacteroidales bacterium]
MRNFSFQNTTKLIFGEGSISKISSEIPHDKRIMLTFGGGSVKQNGVYEQVRAALANHNYMEFWGIEPNPKVETLREAIELGKRKNIDFILAVGGGSVLDGTKLIASAIPYPGDAWQLVLNPFLIQSTVPFADVITLPATGSEMNEGAVISNLDTREKYAFQSAYPQFSILDPSTTFSLPPFQIACGIADSFIHVMEQYLVDKNNSPLMDRWAEGLLLTLIEIAPKIRQNQHDYEQMANFMLSATMALNGFISMGCFSDWATHMIGHELTALTGLTHGETLVIVEPALLRIMKNEKRKKLLQFAERIWNISESDEDKKIALAIEKTEQFYRSLPLKTKLSEHNIGDDVCEEIANRFYKRGIRLGENATINADTVKKILELCK